ncbi:galactomannan galactosyltransferase 1-like [Lotus japonicus]|uniref:Galactomannan galactosyltransferase n=1 Tax=Lotus japonicus TaxID=34305 RepID=Q7X9N4_LOTJA|nr:galactomannan galactosyltransferase 1-like [Lotus japonicus]CAD98924.1 galactomannan galactosyltransferase [Lotus japonicus]
MARLGSRNKSSLWLSDGCCFLTGALSALLLVWGLCSFIIPFPNTDPKLNSVAAKLKSLNLPRNQITTSSAQDLLYDSPETTFYDDPEMSYTMDKPVTNWDEKRRQWLLHHPSFAAGASDRILLVTGSQPKRCHNPIGDHLLLRFFKNKVDYCRIHDIDIIYNNALLHPKMNSYWAKYPVVKAAMIAHPEVEWIWWVDSDAVITDMEFKLPLNRYNEFNLIIHGWEDLVKKKHSWTGLNAGVFLMRNCQWSLDFMDVWAAMGPSSPDYKKWGEKLMATFKDKVIPDSDDQTALAYLIAMGEDKWTEKIYLEKDYYFEGYWVELAKMYENVSVRYDEVERRVGGLRRRHAEKVSERYGEMREEHVKYFGQWRRPFITHFTGCQPCNGHHNPAYAADDCWNGMDRALNFADNQVLRTYGYVRRSLNDKAVTPIPYDYPAA